MERSRYPPNCVLRTLATSNTLSMPSIPYACGVVNSPVSNLTLNLSELNTGRATPRRKLSLCVLDTPESSSKPTPERSFSTESGCFVDTPSPIESPTFELCLQRFSNQQPDVQPRAETRKKSCSFRKFNSMPIPMMGMSLGDLENDGIPTNTQSTPFAALDFGNCITSPTKKMDMSDETLTDISSDVHLSGGSSGSEDSFKKKVAFFIDESNSQDSGFECDKDSRDANHLEDGFEFAAPQGIPPSFRRHSKIISEDTCSPFKYSPVKVCSPSKRRNSCPVGSLDFSGEIVKSEDEENCPDSPLKMCRLTSVDEGIVGDGFLDFMDEEVAKLTTKRTSSAMSSLFTAPLINKGEHMSYGDDDTPVTRRVISRRYLHRSQSMNIRSMDERVKRESPDDLDSPMQCTFKRNKPQDESTPRQEQKRMRSSSSMDSPVSISSKPVLHRCHSESEAMIKSALNRQADEPDLIGDSSKTYCLPTITGKHNDLKSISSETVSRVIAGEFTDVIDKAFIVDCRYPYEYQGGHVKGADNIYTHESIKDTFLKNPITSSDPNKRTILIFHCEFSSERGPKLSRFLRSQDRQANKDCYPSLHYPEIYLLEGGYKVFFETEKENCVPPTYKPMLHPDHNDDLRMCRIKSKSWAGEQRSNRSGFRPLKF